MKQLRKPFQHTQTLVINEVREQVQEDVITYMNGRGATHPRWLATGTSIQPMIDDLCQIVVDNFKRLEDDRWLYETKRLEDE